MMLSAPLAALALATTCRMSLGREELALLDVDRLAGGRDRLDEVGLPAQERGRLQHVDRRGDGGDLVDRVHVGQHRHVDVPADVGEDREALRHARARETTRASCGSPCRTTT